MTDSKNINHKNKPEPVTDDSVNADAVSISLEHIKSVQANSKQNSPNVDMGSSWATTVSQYLIQRRKQTQLAYHAQLAPNTQLESNTICDDSDKISDRQDWLFEAMFEVLVQRLEEGHTVVVLENANHDSINIEMNEDGYAELFAWQQQLLQPLLLSLIDIAVTDNTVIDLLEQDALWTAAMGQSILPEYDKQVLEQRRSTCVKLYKLLQQIASASSSVENSLSKLTTILNNQNFFENANNKKNQVNKPIIFQVENNLDNEHPTITLWLHRTWQAEYALAHHIIRIKEQNVKALPITLNSLLNTEQQNAIHMANQSAFSIITGGPGTGKTFTVAQLVIALQQDQGVAGEASKVNLALAAPTGKAAQRMQESLQDAIQHAGVSIQLPEAKTIHRLLGIGQGGRPRYHDKNLLSEDIVIIDEASMLGVELANHLVSAIKPNARLILLGDANQLAAVDAGAVLADLCRIPALQDVHQRLEISRRFKADSGIGKLAQLINQVGENQCNAQNMAAIWQLLQQDEALSFYQLTTVSSEDTVNNNNITSNIIINSLSNYNFLKKMTTLYNNYINQTKELLAEIKQEKSVPREKYINEFNKLITTLNQFRVLTAGHHGRCGDHYINQYLSEQHRTQLKLPLSKSPWYHGRPIMLLQNNYELGLFNGDIGICLQTERNRLQVFFENKTQGIAINMFSDEMIATAYAMTIHKSQGSEFEHVAISFDDHNGRLLSQELIYTAVTRAKKQVSIFSTASAFTRALSTPTKRQTGLSLQFAGLHKTSDRH